MMRFYVVASRVSSDNFVMVLLSPLVLKRNVEEFKV